MTLARLYAELGRAAQQREHAERELADCPLSRYLARRCARLAAHPHPPRTRLRYGPK